MASKRSPVRARHTPPIIFMKKINLAIIIGGPSTENEVSHSSAKVIINKLNKEKYNIIPIVVSADSEWHFFDSVKDYLLKKTNNSGLAVGAALCKIKQLKIDIVYIAMHGAFGEDGTMQALLDSISVPYNGSGIEASSIAMDKVRSSELFAYHGLKIPPFITFTELEWQKDCEEIVSQMDDRFKNKDLVVKPTNLGSSISTYIIKSKNKLIDSINRAFDNCELMMVQEYIEGREMTCGVVDLGKPREIFALPPTEIVPKDSNFFDYGSKYTKNSAKEITPPKLSSGQIKRIQEIAIRAHQIIGCKGITRTDMIFREEEIYVLEINTLPGMTETSLIPQSAKVYGIGFSELLDKIISHTIKVRI